MIFSEGGGTVARGQGCSWNDIAFARIPETASPFPIPFGPPESRTSTRTWRSQFWRGWFYWTFRSPRALLVSRPSHPLLRLFGGLLLSLWFPAFLTSERLFVCFCMPLSLSLVLLLFLCRSVILLWRLCLFVCPLSCSFLAIIIIYLFWL